MKGIMICLLLCISACSYKPVAYPNEVNDYLNKICYKSEILTERSTFDLSFLND